MNTVNTCSNCGAKNFFTRRFCGNCGAPLYSQGNYINIHPEKATGITYTQSLLLGVIVIIIIVIGSVLIWQFGFNNNQVPQSQPAQSVNVTIDWPYGQTSNAAVQISNVTVISVGDTSATIIWYTDLPSSTQVEYGRVLYTYGMIAPIVPQDDPTQGSTGVTYHIVYLNNLTSGATYYFRVRSKDANGNETVSADGTSFRTTQTQSTYVGD